MHLVYSSFAFFAVVSLILDTELFFIFRLNFLFIFFKYVYRQFECLCLLACK